MINSKEWTIGIRSLDQLIFDGTVKVFSTRKEATTAARGIGWRQTMRVQRKYERVWIVGMEDFQPTEVAGITNDTLTIPLFVESGDVPTIEARRVREDP